MIDFMSSTDLPHHLQHQQDQLSPSGMNHGMSTSSQNQVSAMLRAAQQQGQQQQGHQSQQQQGFNQQQCNSGGFGGMNPMAMFQQQQFNPQQPQHQQMNQQGGMGGMSGMGGYGSGNNDMQQQHNQNQQLNQSYNSGSTGSDQQQLNQLSNQQQQQSGQGGGGAGGFDIGSELKRIQQLHQLGNSGGGPGSNALLMTGAGRPGNDPSASLMQSLLDQQKVQAPRFDNPLVAQNALGGNPLLQPSFLQDARLLMAQNQLNAATALQAQRQEVPLPSPHSLFHRDGSRRMRGGVIEPFPEKLHRLLTEVEAAGRSDVISFVANGRAFAIHKPDKFFKEIVPLYFRQSRLSSFKRQLNLYGFELINSGPARGGYFHELFVKEAPELCRRMRRVAVKVGSKDVKDGKDAGSKGEGKEGDNKQHNDSLEGSHLHIKDESGL